MTQDMAVNIMLALQIGTFLGVGGIAVWVFKMGRWMGEVDQKFTSNATDHLRYERDIRAIQVQRGE